MSLPWRSGRPRESATGHPYLVLQNPAGDPIEVALMVDDDGWTVSFHVGISDTRTLAQVEGFIARCRKFLLDEPVVPD